MSGDAIKPVTAAEFERGGGFEFADDVAAGMQKRCDETLGYGGRGFMVNATEMLWLLHAYREMQATR